MARNSKSQASRYTGRSGINKACTTNDKKSKFKRQNDNKKSKVRTRKTSKSKKEDLLSIEYPESSPFERLISPVGCVTKKDVKIY